MNWRHHARLVVVLAVGLIGLLIGGRQSSAAQNPQVGDTRNAAAGKPVQGSIVMGDKTYKAAHAVAFEDASRSEKSTIVLICSQPIPEEKLRASLKKNGNDDDLNLFHPQVKLRFDADRKLGYFFLWADDTSINISNSDLTGKLTLENGRASGTASYKKAQEPGSSFPGYSFDVTFDLPLIAVPREKEEPKPASAPRTSPKSTPSIRPSRKPKDSDTPQAEAPGAINIHDVLLPADAKDVEYKELVEMVNLKSPSPVRTVATFFIDKLKQSGWTNPSPLITDKSSILNAKKGDASLTIFVTSDGGGSTVTIMARGLSWNEKQTGNPSPETTERKPAPAAEPAEPEEVVELAAEEKSGYPVPEASTSYSSGGTKYLRKVDTQVAAGLKSVVNFYRREAKQRNWKETDGTKIEANQARLLFTGGPGQITVLLQRKGEETTIQLAARDADKAKQDGVAPKPGQSCLLLGNADGQEVTIIINKNNYRIPAGTGAQDPKQSKRFDIQPGKYDIQIKLPDGKVQSETLTIGPNESWGIIATPGGGYFADQLY